MTGWITRNLGIKLLSIGLAILFWLLVVSDDQELATSISVPIQFRNIPKDLELSSDVSEKVHLEIRGPAARLAPAQLSETAAVIDLAGVTRPGDHTFPILADTTTLPTGVSLDRAVPSMIRMRFERRVAREVSVKVRVSNQPPSNLVLVGILVEPAKVRILGPESRVSDETIVETDPVDLSGVTEPTSIPVRVFLADPQVRIEGSGKVTVKVDVRPKQ